MAPLFDPSCTEREREAVDSEHKKNIGNDGWRLRRLIKHLASEDHAYRNFGTGYRETLMGSETENIRNILIEFYRLNYSAHLMKLVVFGKEPTSVLSEWVREKFSAVKTLLPNPNPLPSWVSLPPFDKSHYGQIIWAKPLKAMKSLSIEWVVSDYRTSYKSKVHDYISHLIGYEGSGSLYAFLKKKGWVVSLSAGESENVTGFSMFSIDFNLTTEGLVYYKDVIRYVFAFIHMLQKEEPKLSIFEEVLDLLPVRLYLNYISSVAK